VITCPHCGFENGEGVIFCEHCRTNVHCLPVARQPESAEVLRERLANAERKLELWQSLCITGWVALPCMFLFCLAAWGAPFGILGFLFLCLFAIPVLVVVSIAFVGARQDHSDAERRLGEAYPIGH
jgi:hypothetical protein